MRVLGRLRKPISATFIFPKPGETSDLHNARVQYLVDGIARRHRLLTIVHPFLPGDYQGSKPRLYFYSFPPFFFFQRPTPSELEVKYSPDRFKHVSPLGDVVSRRSLNYSELQYNSFLNFISAARVYSDAVFHEEFRPFHESLRRFGLGSSQQPSLQEFITAFNSAIRTKARQYRLVDSRLLRDLRRSAREGRHAIVLDGSDHPFLLERLSREGRHGITLQHPSQSGPLESGWMYRFGHSDIEAMRRYYEGSSVTRTIQGVLAVRYLVENSLGGSRLSGNALRIIRQKITPERVRELLTDENPWRSINELAEEIAES